MIMVNKHHMADFKCVWLGSEERRATLCLKFRVPEGVMIAGRAMCIVELANTRLTEREWIWKGGCSLRSCS